MSQELVKISPQLLALLQGSGQDLKPFGREIFLLDIIVAGTSHCQIIEELAEDIHDGTMLNMLRDPGNEYDPMAIGLYLDKRRVGWVPMELNVVISRLMDAGKIFVCRVEKTKWIDNWFRIEAKISMID